MSARVVTVLIFLAALMAAPKMPATTQNGSSNDPASAASPQGEATAKGSSTASADKAAKKVWTNDDMSGLQNDVVSSTGVAHTAQPAGSGQKFANPKGHTAKWYHDQIAKLQAKIPPLDSQIDQLQSAIDGKPTGNTKTSQRPAGVKADDWSLELKQFQAERDDLASKISALEDEARHNGIPENALR